MKVTLFALLSLLPMYLWISIWPMALYGAPQSQTNQATLRIENNSDEPIILCDIFAVRSPNHVELSLEEKVTIAPDSYQSFSIPQGKYRILLSDCDQIPLFQESNISITDTYVVTIAPQSASAEACAMHHKQGQDHYAQQDFAAALVSFQSAYTCYQQLHNPALAAAALNSVGLVYLAQEKFDKALSHFEHALSNLRQAKAHEYQEVILTNLGDTYLRLERFQEAQQAFEEAIRLAEETGNLEYQALRLNLLADILSERGDYSKAVVHLDRALVVARKINNLEQERILLANLALTYIYLGKLAKAQETAQMILDNFTEGEEIETAREILEHPDEKLYFRAVRQFRAGEYTHAITLLQLLLKQYPDSALTVDTLIALIVSHYQANNYAESITFSERLLNEYPDSDWVEIALLSLANSHLELGHYDKARTAAEDMLQRFPNNETIISGEIFVQLANAYESLGRRQDALTIFEEALKIVEKTGNQPFQATILNNIGNIYGRQGHYQEAIVNYQKALQIQQQLGTPSIEGTILNGLANAYSGLGEYDKALSIFEQALKINREIGNPEDEASTLNNIATTYREQGRFTEAIELAQQALVLIRQTDNLAGEVTILNNLGILYADQGRSAKALEIQREVLDLARKSENRSLEATALNNIGEAYTDQQQYEQALEHLMAALTTRTELGELGNKASTLNHIGDVYLAQRGFTDALKTYEQALAIQQQIGDPAGQADTLNDLGRVYETQGKYEAAIAKFEEALALRRQLGDQSGIGTCLNNIGAVYMQQGRYSDALMLYGQSLEIARQLGKREAQGSALHNLGVVYKLLGRYAEAEDVHQQALQIRRENGNRRDEANELNSFGLLYAVQGRNANAIEAYEQALAIYQEIKEQLGEAIVLNNVCELFLRQGQYAEGQKSCQRSLTLARQLEARALEGTILLNIGSGCDAQECYGEALQAYELALEIARELGKRGEEASALTNMGAVYGRQGQGAKAIEMYQQALTITKDINAPLVEAKIFYNIGFEHQTRGRLVEAAEAYERAMTVIETVRSIVGDDQARSGFFDQYVQLYHRSVEVYHRQGQDVRAFLSSERSRARVFLDSITTGQINLDDEQSMTLWSREQDAYFELQAARDELAEVRAQIPQEPQLVSARVTHLTEAEKKYDMILAEIEAQNTKLYELVPSRNQILSLSQVQALLDDQTTLVSYWHSFDQTLAFIITKHKLHVIELPAATIQAVANALDDLRKWGNLEQPHPASLQKLNAMLIEPLSNHLTTPHLTIIPHLRLHYVPFAALTDGKTYLGQRHTISIIPLVSALPAILTNERLAQDATHSNALVLGNPTVNSELLEPLIYAESEATTVASLLGVSAYVTATASEELIWNNMQNLRVLHLAAHGTFDPVNPLQSAIFLAPEGEYDGRLSAGEIFGLPLAGNNLVVLSACETNVGALSLGDELVGLTRAFFFAGSPTVISSLWNVDDAATEKLMVSFYTHWLQEGMSKAEALQAAQADVRADPRWVSPFYWAGFVLNGDPGASEAK